MKVFSKTPYEKPSKNSSCLIPTLCPAFARRDVALNITMVQDVSMPPIYPKPMMGATTFPKLPPKLTAISVPLISSAFTAKVPP